MNKAQIVFLGDISLNEQYVEFYKKGINPFSKISNKLFFSKFVVGNLECLVKGSQGENLLKKPRLTSTKETLNYLNKLNINLVSLAHNHIFSFHRSILHLILILSLLADLILNLHLSDHLPRRN